MQGAVPALGGRRGRGRDWGIAEESSALVRGETERAGTQTEQVPEKRR